MARERDERADTKRDADTAVHFFDRCVARGLSRKEATELTVAYILHGMAVVEEPEPKEPWEGG